MAANIETIETVQNHFDILSVAHLTVRNGEVQKLTLAPRDLDFDEIDAF